MLHTCAWPIIMVQAVPRWNLCQIKIQNTGKLGFIEHCQLAMQLGYTITVVNLYINASTSIGLCTTVVR